MMGDMRIDLHTHSAVSDGTDTPEQLVRHAALAGLEVIALTDHDTIDGIAAAQAAGRAEGVRVIAGLELSTELDGHSVHLLAYGTRPDDAELSAELVLLRESRSGRVEAFAGRLTELGMEITAAEIWQAAGSAPSVGRPHVADAMVSRGYVADRNEAFAQWLGDDKPAYVTRYATALGRAIDLVHGAGGAAVIAHPWGRGSREVLTTEVLTRLVRDHGLDGIEVDHEDHDERDRKELARLATGLGLVATGSSDHHGVGKVDHPLGVNVTHEAALEHLLRIITTRGGLPG